VVKSSALQLLKNPFKPPTELTKGAVAGLVVGLIGTIVMTAFQDGWSKASKAIGGNHKQRIKKMAKMPR
jgi:hypothetical protein